MSHTLIEIARQAVADLCSIKLEDVQLEEGTISVYSGADEKTSIQLSIGEDDDIPTYIFSSIILEGVGSSPGIDKALNEINIELSVGQVYQDDDDVMFWYKLPCSQPSLQAVKWIIRTILSEVTSHAEYLSRALHAASQGNIT